MPMEPLESWILVMFCVGITVASVWLFVRYSDKIEEDER